MTEYRTVPCEPTEEMLRAAGVFPGTYGEGATRSLWKDMLAAAPEASDELTDAQLADACMWFRHDFGLLSEEDRATEMYSMREHWRALWKAQNTPGRGGQFAPQPPDELAELERFIAGYQEAIEDIEGWGCYAAEYFQDKHDLAGCVAKHKALLEEFRGLVRVKE